MISRAKFDRRVAQRVVGRQRLNDGQLERGARRGHSSRRPAGRPARRARAFGMSQIAVSSWFYQFTRAYCTVHLILYCSFSILEIDFTCLADTL
jgi:hypothetical protein